MQIRQVVQADLAQVSKIHVEELPYDFCSLLGQNFLTTIFYPELLEVSEVALCVADNESINGFVFFSCEGRFFRNLATKHFPRMAYYALRRIFSLRFLRYVFEVLLLLRMHDDALRGAELAYMAVYKPFQGQGLGSELVGKGLADLQRQGITSCWLKTLTSTPENVRFYEKLGFRQVKTYLGRVYMAIDLHESA